jgi:LPXTG-site transpeptidase (sortase) family protein
MSHTLTRLAQVGLILAALLLTACGGDRNTNQNQGGSGAISGLPSATATPRSEASPSPEASPAATGFRAPTEGAVLEFVKISRIAMNAPVETKGINSRGEMEDPSGRDHIAWYDFSEFPGFGGNAVFSGHVDWYTGELGVFGRMKELQEGDEIVVRLSDGMEMTYKVISSALYESHKAPVGDITARTEKDSLTFITCEGAFDRRASDYSHRRVVRAERIS